jgi:hypothetical protein
LFAVLIASGQNVIGLGVVFVFVFHVFYQKQKKLFFFAQKSFFLLKKINQWKNKQSKACNKIILNLLLACF